MMMLPKEEKYIQEILILGVSFSFNTQRKQRAWLPIFP